MKRLSMIVIRGWLRPAKVVEGITVVVRERIPPFGRNDKGWGTIRGWNGKESGGMTKS
jgi:hypothetical protein